MEISLKLNYLCSLAYISCLIVSALCSPTIPLESTTSASSEVTYCTYSQACGWIVYDQDKPKMMIKNFCTCSDGHYCVKTYHEPSNRADVYNCRSSSQAEGKERWPTSKVFSTSSSNRSQFRDSGRLSDN